MTFQRTYPRKTERVGAHGNSSQEQFSGAERKKKNSEEMFPLQWRQTSRTQKKAGGPEDATGNHTGKTNVGGDD